MSGTNTEQNFASGETGGASDTSEILPSSIGGLAAVDDPSGRSGNAAQSLGSSDQPNSTKVGTIDGSGTPSAGGAGGGT